MHAILPFLLLLFVGGCRDFTVPVEADLAWDVSGTWSAVAQTDRTLSFVIVDDGGEGYLFDGAQGHEFVLEVFVDGTNVAIYFRGGSFEGRLTGGELRGYLTWQQELFQMILVRT